MKAKIAAPALVILLISRAPTAAHLLMKRLAAAMVIAIALTGGALGQEDDPPRIDYLTFAQGAVPIAIGGAGANAESAPHATHQVQWIDGDPTPRGFITTTDLGIATEFIYRLPALTTFDRLAIPNILEVPSAYTTFTKFVEVHGSSLGADEGWQLLAKDTLETHRTRNEVHELEILATPPVRWVKLVLRSGIENLSEDQMSFEFSEIIGNGSQEPKPLADNFTGAWSGRRRAQMELVQDGPIVTGCYDQNGLLEGTVDGNILRATGIDQGAAKTPSTFILTVMEDGSLNGVRSTNGGPFRVYEGPAVDDVERLDCLVPEPKLGCGSVVHGIQFDFDSAVLRGESTPILEKLFDGLSSDSDSTVVIRGHTSSEGSTDYNLSLSQRRAQAVVDDLVTRGLRAERLSAIGVGEAEPIADNRNESGRSLNRRVEVLCQ